MPVKHLDGAPYVDWHVTDSVMDPVIRDVLAVATHSAALSRHRAYQHMTRTSAYCVVVAIGHGDQDNYRPALRLAAYEAEHRGLAIKLVHGCGEQPGLAGGSVEASARIRRGRRILKVAAREMRELVDGKVRVYTNNSLLPAVDTLLDESVTAPLIVLQRTPTTSRQPDAPGPTLSVIATQASCPVALAPSRISRRLMTGLVIKMRDHDRSALAKSAAWDEAGLRRVPLIVEHAWDGPFSRSLSAAHLPPSRTELQHDRERDLHRLANLVSALETSSTATDLNTALQQAVRE